MTAAARPLNDWRRADLLALPLIPWTEFTAPIGFDSLLILPSASRHDSGYRAITLIGVTRLEPQRIITTHSDDLCWAFPPTAQPRWDIRTDCLWRSRALHMWSLRSSPNRGQSPWQFWVDLPVSPLAITLGERP